jgi:hypothetical protein
MIAPARSAPRRSERVERSVSLDIGTGDGKREFTI